MTNSKQEKIEKISGSRVKFSVSVDAVQMEKSKKLALAEIGEKIEVGGFRKGKAPISVIEKNVDKEKLLLETVDIAVKNAYYDFVMEKKEEFLTIGTPKIEFASQVDRDVFEKGFTINVEVDIYPEIVLPDIDKLKVKKEDSTVTEKELLATIDDILKKRSKLELHDEKHKSEKGDWVDVDFDILIDDKIEPELGSKNFPLVVGNNTMIPGFEDNLIGLQKGSEKEFDLDIDDGFRDKRMAGKKVKFNVKVNEIKKLVPPVLDDEFVKTLSIEGVEGVESFKKYLQESLQKEKDITSAEKLKNDIISEIEKNVAAEIPLSLQERELHMMWHEFEDNLKKRGIEPTDYMQKEGLDETKVKEGWKEQADKRAKIALIVGEMVKEFKITVDKDEISDYIKRELDKVAESLKYNHRQNWREILKDYEKEYNSKDRRNYFEQQLMIDKLFELLIGKMSK